MHRTDSTAYATAERATPEAIEASRRSIAASEILVTVLDALPQQVMILNRHRQLVFGNTAANAMGAALGQPVMLGLRPGEILSCHAARETPTGCGTSEACRNCGAVGAILDTLDGCRSERECRISRAGQRGPEALDLRIRTTPFRWQDEDYVLFVASDIADEKRRQVLERVFFHDIMNTAGGINSMAEMLSTGDLEFDEVKGDLAIAAGTLVQEIKSQRILVAAESNALAVQPAPLDTAEFLDDLVHTFRNHEVARRKNIRVAPWSARCTFTCDPALLTRVIGNLAKNALEASKPGDEVTLACTREGQYVTFTCHNAQDMPRDVQLQVFQRSFSTKGRDRGIGTYSIKLLTEKYLGGVVTFRSSPEAGTVFSVILPREAGWGQ